MTASPFPAELLCKDNNTRVPPNENHLPDFKKTDTWHESDNPPRSNGSANSSDQLITAKLHLLSVVLKQ